MWCGVRGNLRLKGRKNKSLPLIRPLRHYLSACRQPYSQPSSQAGSKHPGNDKYLMTVILRNISARASIFLFPRQQAQRRASFSSSSLPFLLSSLCSQRAAALSKVSMELKGKACSALKRESERERERERRQGAQPFAVSS